MKENLRFLYITIFTLLVIMPGPVLSQDWSDNFEAHTTGDFPSAAADPAWDTWSSDPAGAANEYGEVSTVQALSGTNSLMISDTNDIIVQLSQVASGVWAVKVNYYIPQDVTGKIYFILMNQFTSGCPGDADPPCKWAMQLEMNCDDAEEKVTVDGLSNDLVLDDWAELEVVFDLNANKRDVYYNGEALSLGADYVTDGTAVALAAIDLYAAGGSGPVYMDDISVAQVPAPFRATQSGADVVLDWGIPAEASKTALDISSAFNADVVFSPGEAIADQDYFDYNAAVLTQDEFDGTGTPNTNAQGLPANGLVGQFLLEAYDAPNALQFREGGDTSPVNIDLADGQYGSLLYCTACGNGGVTVPVTITYTDATTEDAQIISRDWYWGADEGLTTVIDNMDRIKGDGSFDDVNNPALFSGTIPLDSAKTLDSITLKPADATADWAAGGDNVVFNLMAVSAVEHVAYELTREGDASETATVTFNEGNAYLDAEVPEDFLTYTLIPTVGGIELEAQTAAVCTIFTGLGSNGSIDEQLLLAQYMQTHGSNPPHDQMTLDYLTEGEGGLNEQNIIPVEGLQMETDYAVAESTGCTIGNAEAPYTCPPTWVAFHGQSYLNFNDIFSDINNVMSYQVTYLTNTTPDPLEATIHYKTDDGAIIMINNAVIAERLSGCCSWVTQDIFVMPGEHRLMLKTFEAGGGFNADWRITARDGSPFPCGALTASTEPTIETLPPAPAVSVTRSAPGYILSTDTEIEITLSLPEDNTTPIDVIEQIPAGYGEPLEITGDGTWDGANGEIVWTGITETVTYTITPVPDLPVPSGYMNDPDNGLLMVLGGTLPSVLEVTDLGDGWTTAFIGDDNGATGEVVSFDEDAGLYETEINAGGSDIWGTADEFQYIWKDFGVSEYVEITGRLDSFQQGVNNWSKAGLMFRQNLSRGSPAVWGVQRAQDYNGYLQWRDVQNGGAARDGGVNLTGMNVPSWFKAVYISGSVTVFYATDDAYESADDVVWDDNEQTHPLNIADTDIFTGGICVTSHNNGTMVNAQFSNIAVHAAAGPLVENVAVAENVDGNPELTWELYGDASFDSIVIERMMMPVDQDWTEIADVATDATSYVDTTEGLFKGQYRFVATYDDTETATEALSVTLTADYTASTPPEGEYLNAVLADNPIAYWRFSEGEGTATAFNWGSLGSAVDGAYNGGIALEEPGLLGTEEDTAALFNGIDSFVKPPNNGQINTNGPFHTASLEFWFRADIVPTDAAMIYEQGGGTRGISIYVKRVDDVPRLYMMAWNRAEEEWGTGADPLYVSTAIEEGIAYHAVMVFEASTNGATYGDFDGRITGYLNGELFEDVAGADQLYNHSGDIKLGHPSDTVVHEGGKTWFTGVIDEFSYYNTLLDDPNGDGDLSDSVVAAHYDAGTTNLVKRFIGDANCDGAVDISDAIATLSYLFAGGDACCLTNMDANADGGVNIADVIAKLSYLFSGGDIVAPDGIVIETPGCTDYDPADINEAVLECETPCQ